MNDPSLTQKEKDLLKVITHQLNEANALPSLTDTQSALDDRVHESRALMQSLGIEVDAMATTQTKPPPKPIPLRSFEELLTKANKAYPKDVSFKDIFTAQELDANMAYIEQLNDEFDAVHRLDMIDVMIPAVAGVLGGAVDCLFGGFIKGAKDKMIPGTMSEWIHTQFDKLLTPEKIKELEKLSKVTYDAQDNRNTTIDVDGLSSWFHRHVSLGHDPVLGFVFGVIDMLRGTMTTLDYNGKLVIQAMEVYDARKAQSLFEAIAKVFLHMLSDVNTSRGLPVPFMVLFNSIQTGKIGDHDTIAELVKSMYGQGYDFRHFCSMSIPVMITEVIVRVSYFAKRLSEGYSFAQAVPIGTNHIKKPKLGTMLFIAHTASVAINAGKVAITKQPLNINYPEWLAFAKYSVKQLKWVVIDKPAQREKYVMGILNGEWDSLQADMVELWDDYIFVVS